jgi:hypothetical protein
MGFFVCWARSWVWLRFWGRRCSCLCCFCSRRLPGAGVTFFAAAKKVTKESGFTPSAQGARHHVYFKFSLGHNSPPPLRPARPARLSVPSRSRVTLCLSKWHAVILPALPALRAAGRYSNETGSQLPLTSKQTPSLKRYSALQPLALQCTWLGRRAANVEVAFIEVPAKVRPNSASAMPLAPLAWCYVI